ncbi:hypothetical protein MASR1M90_21730 [Desulfovibrionales bacterium]
MIVVIRKCLECPFMALVDGVKVCNIATPYQRPTGDEDRPSWCKLRKEQIIVRDFK